MVNHDEFSWCEQKLQFFGIKLEFSRLLTWGTSMVNDGFFSMATNKFWLPKEPLIQGMSRNYSSKGPEELEIIGPNFILIDSGGVLGLIFSRKKSEHGGGGGTLEGSPEWDLQLFCRSSFPKTFNFRLYMKDEDIIFFKNKLQMHS